MSDEYSKPKYMKQEFYDKVLSHINFFRNSISKRKPIYIAHLDKEVESHFKKVDEEKLFYLENIISDDEMLRVFFADNSDNYDLLTAVFAVFLSLADWRHDYKTSGKQDSTLANKLEKKFRECAKLLMDSPDLAINAQLFWEQHLRKVINDSYKGNLTEKGESVKSAAKKLIFPSFMNELELENDGIIIDKTNTIEHSRHIHLTGIMIDLAQYMADIAPAAERKSNIVKKLNAEDAHIHYAVRRLKKVLGLA